jgi:phosphate-selective porin OprO/OprP
MRRSVAIVVGSSLVTLTVSSVVAAQDPAAQPAKSEKFHFTWKNHPTLWIGGRAIEVGFRGRIQTLGRMRVDGGSSEVDARQRRFGIKGTILRRFDYEVTRELGSSVDPWRDVYLNAQVVSPLQVQVGKFKVPFSRDQLAGNSDDFIFRSLLGRTFAPGRDRGVMLQGNIVGKSLTYAAGIFRHDGENVHVDLDDSFSSVDDARPDTQRSLAARLTIMPLRLMRASRRFRDLDIGFSATESQIPEGLNSLRGRSVFQHTFFPRVYVRGRRLRVGSDLDWRLGPVSIGGEVAQVREERLGQGLRNEDLPEMASNGWYARAGWVVTGEEKKSGEVEPRRPIGQSGVGAIELGARVEEMSFGSRDHLGPAFRNPRAANILGNRDRVWTFGVNWYANRWIKFQTNAIRESIQDLERSPQNRPIFWSGAWQLQLAF